MKKVLCIMISAVMLGTSVSSAFAVNEPTGLSVSGQQVEIDPMSVVTEPPFGFEIVSVGRDSVTASFVSEGRITDPPYVGIKGTKTATEKTGNLQYVLEYGKEYSFAYTVTEGENEVVYNSFVTVESGESPEVVFGAVLSNMVGAEISRSAGSVCEEEDNGVWLFADWTDDDYDNYGTISSEDDVDWWRLSFPSDGVANFWLGNIPEGCDYDLYLFDEDCAGSGYGYELECSVNEGNTPELIQYEVVEGQEFFVRVESFEGYSDDSYYLFRAKVYPTGTEVPEPETEAPEPEPEPEILTWFCQSDATVGTTWNTNHLTNLYFPNMPGEKDEDEKCEHCAPILKCANTPFYTTSSYEPAYNQLDKGHMNKFGCYISSFAMIFRNLEAVTVNNQYDFRTRTTSRLQADPFTLTMANIGWPTITQSGNRYEILSYTNYLTPVNVNSWTIAYAFGLTPKRIELYGKTPEEKADTLAFYIEQNPEGIMVRISGVHSLVFTDTTHPVPASLRGDFPQPIRITQENEHLFVEEPIAEWNRSATVTSTDYDDKFICYDPADSDPSQAMGVPYDESWTALNCGGIDMISYFIYFE